MNIYNVIYKILLKAVDKLNYSEFLSDNFTVENTKFEKYGDISTNIAMIIAKTKRDNPRNIANDIIELIQSEDIFDNIELAGAGFINFYINKKYWHNLLIDIFNQQDDYGKNDIGLGKTVNIEFVSANPTGPLHLGHIRGAINGDIIANILEFSNYQVTREYYVNNAGNQVRILGESLFMRYKEIISGKKIEIPEGYYPGDYLIDIANKFIEKYSEIYIESNYDDIKDIIQEFAVNEIMNIIRGQLKRINIVFDNYIFEKDLVDNNKIEESIELLKQKDLIYNGIPEKPKSSNIENWVSEPQMMFKSKNFGDDEDRVVKNHKGNWTYFANDVAYHYDKVKRNYNHLIIELGTDHIGYSKRLKSAVHALSEGKCNISTIFHDLVNLEENGNILKMSKRDGNFITIDDLLEKIDQDVIRFIIMTRKSEALINFDITKAQDKSKDNPVFYVQYAHARIYSVFRNSNVSLDELNSVNIEILSLLNSKYEIDIIRKLAYWPRIVESSCIKLEAHFITFYLQELSSLFHNLWSLGNDDKSLRFISDNKKLTIARLYLLQSIAIVIGAGLKLLGVKPIEEM